MAIAERTEQAEGVFSPRYRAYMLGVLFVTYALNFVDRNILSMLLPQIKAELVLADWQLGVLGGIAFALFYTTMGLPIASLADRANRVNIISISIAVWSLMTALSGSVTNFVQLLLVRAGVGVGEAGATPPAHPIIGDVYPPEQRSSAIGIYSVGASVGSFLGFLVGGWVAQYYGWRTAFIVVGLPGVLWALFVKLTLREPPRGMSETTERVGENAPMWDVIRLLWSRPTFRHLSLAAALSALAGYGSGLWTPSFLVRSHGLGLGEIGTWLAMFSLVGGAIGVGGGSILADWLAKRDPRWWMWLPGIVVLIGLPFTAVGYLASNIWLVLACLFVPSFTANLYPGPAYSTTQKLVGLRMRSVASAFILFILTLIGLGIGPFIVGAVSDFFSTQYGSDALRYSLLAALGFKVWSAAHFFLAGRTIVADLARAPE